MEYLKEEIQTLIAKLSAEEGMDLLDLKFSLRGQTVIIRVTADFPSGGISLAQCAMLNKRISRALEELAAIETDYTIEVNSPGTDWPLTSAKDFLRVIGRRVKVFLNQAWEGQIEFEGVLESVEGETVRVHTASGSKDIPLSFIHKGVQNL